MNKCPKCGQTAEPSQEICPHCGIVFAKYFKYHGSTPQPKRQTIPSFGLQVEPDAGWLQTLLAHDTYRQSVTAFWGRCLLLPIFLIWSWLLMAGDAAETSFVHNVNLPFHEAGHIIFRPFGQFITSLGGTLGQLLMPAVCMVTLLVKTRDPYGAALALWWLGENFLDIAPYINDARAGQLPLLGGNFGESSPYGFHDWEYILTESGLLRHDHLLARLSHLTGSLLMISALCFCTYLASKHWRSLNTPQED